MTETPSRKAWAYSYQNQDFLQIETHSGYRSSLPDPDGERCVLSPSAPDDEIGAAVLRALKASRFLHPSEAPHFFDMRGRVVPEYQTWVKATMERFGYKSKRSMFRDMKSCGIEWEGGTITIHPSHHEKLEAWSGAGIGEAERVRVPGDSSAAEIGAALRLAFSRCT